MDDADELHLDDVAAGVAVPVPVPVAAVEAAVAAGAVAHCPPAAAEPVLFDLDLGRIWKQIQKESIFTQPTTHFW